MTSSPADATRTARRRWHFAGGLLAVVLAVWLTWRFVAPALAVTKAEQELQRHDALAAQARLERVLARHPQYERALLLAAEAARRADAYAEAERLLTAFEERAGSSEVSRREWTLLGVQQGDFGTDEEPLRTAVGRNHPDEVVILEALAKGYAAAFRFPDAATALERLLEREPDHAPALVLRSALADRLRRNDAADSDVRRAVTKAPDSALAQAAQARLRSKRGHTRDAVYHFELALRLQPGHPATRLGLVRALADAADLAGAERQLDELLAADPDHVDGLVERGRLALRQNKYAEAEASLAKAVRSAPWHRDGWQLRAIALKELGRADKAARRAELTAEDGVGGRLKLRARDNPGDVAVRLELWAWSVRNGQADEGIAWLAEVLRGDARNAAAHAALADYFERASQSRRAALHRVAAGK